MRKPPPCFPECPERTMTCHQFCQKYKEWKAEDQIRKEEKDKAKELEWITFSNRVKKAVHKKIKEGKKR